jgi:hypothetical protein
MPGNPMLPPPAIAQSINKTAQVAAVVDKRSGSYFKIVVYSTILFFILSYPATYRVINHLYYLITNKSHEIVGEDGCMTLKGSFIHSSAFFAIMIYIVYR